MFVCWLHDLQVCSFSEVSICSLRTSKVFSPCHQGASCEAFRSAVLLSVATADNGAPESTSSSLSLLHWAGTLLKATIGRSIHHLAGVKNTPDV